MASHTKTVFYAHVAKDDAGFGRFLIPTFITKCSYSKYLEYINKSNQDDQFQLMRFANHCLCINGHLAACD